MLPSEAARILTTALSSRTSGNDELHHAAEAVSTLAEHTQLLGIVGAIRNDAEAVQHCAALSGRHPLGHDKITLIDMYPSYRLRLHAWWPNRRPGVEHIHHHRFGFATTVVRGHYEMQIYERATSGIQMTEYHQNSTAAAGEWYLNSAGVAYLRLLTTAKVTAGAGYTLTADALHRVVVPRDTLCLTLFLAVIASGDLSTDTRVYAPPESTAPKLTQGRALTPDDYRRLLDAITAELAGSG